MTPPQDPREYFSDRLPVWLRAASDRFEKTVPDPTEFEAFIAERVGSETLSWIGWALKEELIAEDGDKFHPRDERGKAWQWFRNAPVREWPFGLMWENFIHVAFFARLWGPCRERKKTLRFELERQGTNEYAGKPNIYELDLAVEGADGGVDWYIELKEKKAQAVRLLEDVHRIGREGGINCEPPFDDGDAHRKACTVVEVRPVRLSILALDFESHFRVVYDVRDLSKFELVAGEPLARPLRRPPS